MFIHSSEYCSGGGGVWSAMNLKCKSFTACCCSDPYATFLWQCLQKSGERGFLCTCNSGKCLGGLGSDSCLCPSLRFHVISLNLQQHRPKLPQDILVQVF